MRPDAVEMARGCWREILGWYGIERSFLTGKHGPCPKCHGKDRFRFDDKLGEGTWICGQCGAGYGFQLVELVTGATFKEVCDKIIESKGTMIREKPKPEISDAKRLEMMRDVWRNSKPTKSGDGVDMYLRGRGLDVTEFSGLRTAEALNNGGKNYAAMVGVVSGPDGEVVSLHRTFLADGKKADIEVSRKLMPGTIPAGSAVRLGGEGERIGIAEGIETALAARQMYSIPVWSAISSGMLEKWQAPVKSVIIFGDCDPRYGGQKAAYALAHRLACEGVEVEVFIPERHGDWNDVLIAES